LIVAGLPALPEVSTGWGPSGSNTPPHIGIGFHQSIANEQAHSRCIDTYSAAVDEHFSRVLGISAAIVRNQIDQDFQFFVITAIPLLAELRRVPASF
jgi:hypothetical protein